MGGFGNPGGGGPAPGITVQVTEPIVKITFANGTVRTFMYQTGADVVQNEPPQPEPEPEHG